MPRSNKLKDLSRKLECLQEEIMKMRQDSHTTESEGEIGFDTSRPPKRSRKRIRPFSSSSDEDTSREVTTALIHGSPISRAVQHEDTTLCADSLLGTDPTKLNTAGPPLDADLVVRWTNYLTEGIDKEARDDFQKLFFPENCPQLAAPSLNVEADRLMSSSDKKKDALLASFQDKLGRGLTLLGDVISLLLSQTVPAEIRTLLTPKVALSSKQFCEVHYLLSKHRRHQIFPLFTPATQKVAQESTLDSELFGKHFAEKCKTNLAVEKSAIEIRAKKTAFKKQPARSTPNFSQRQAPKTRMKSEVRSFQSSKRRQPPGKKQYRTYLPQRDNISH